MQFKFFSSNPRQQYTYINFKVKNTKKKSPLPQQEILIASNLY